MMKQAVVLVGGAAFMTALLTPESQILERDQNDPTADTEKPAKSNTVVSFDEDKYWEYDKDAGDDDLVFGEPTLDTDAAAIDNSKTMLKKAPKKAAAAKGKSDWKQEFPRPLD